jgi:hypothetical protein
MYETTYYQRICPYDPLSRIAYQIIRSLASEFSVCSFKHVGQKLNVTAHTLARCSEPSICNTSFDVIPDCIQEVFRNDVG